MDDTGRWRNLAGLDEEQLIKELLIIERMVQPVPLIAFAAVAFSVHGNDKYMLRYYLDDKLRLGLVISVL